MNNFSNVASILMFELFPWIRYIAPGYMGYDLAKSYYDSTKATFVRVIQEHRRDMDIDSPPKVRTNFNLKWLIVTNHGHHLNVYVVYRDGLKSGPVLLSNSQAKPSRNFLQPRDHFLAHLCTG